MAHPDWYDAQQNITAVKARWTEEETRLLARREVALSWQGERFLNQALSSEFPERTFDSIKSRRKQEVYRRIVQEMLEETSDEDDVAEIDEGQQTNASDEYSREITEFLESLPAPRRNDFSVADLLKICRSTSGGNKDAVLEDLALYLRRTFPIKARKRRMKASPEIRPMSRKQRRRVEYAKTQDLWRKNRNKCIRMLLDDVSGVQTPLKDVMVPFWKEVMETNPDTSPGPERLSPTVRELWAPITGAEVMKARPPNMTSAGPDGLTARFLRKVPIEVLVRVLNVILWCGRAPSYLLESITTLIPKKAVL